MDTSKEGLGAFANDIIIKNKRKRGFFSKSPLKKSEEITAA